MGNRKNLQQGSGLIGVIALILALLFVAVLAMKLVPAYLHNREIENIFTAMSHDNSLQHATTSDIRASYTKRAEVDGLDEVSADEIEISQEDGRLVLSANYALKIHLIANLTLVAEFAPTSAK